MLSARDVEEALKERLLRGAYPAGSPLPWVRALAAELGTSPSTIGRVRSKRPDPADDGSSATRDHRPQAVLHDLPRDRPWLATLLVDAAIIGRTVHPAAPSRPSPGGSSR